MAESEEIITLPAMAEISGVVELNERLKAALISERSIRLEAGEVERADAATLQLLTAFMRAAEVDGVSCHWGEVSDAVREAAQLTGLTHELRL